MREFNTEGPVVAEWHYCIPPLERVELDAILGLIRSRRYFVLHAPRQTGKTSTLLALRDLLCSRAGDGFRCVYANVEIAQTAREDVRGAMQAILGELANRAAEGGDRFLDGCWRDILESFGPHNALATALSRWSMADPRPLVLLIDEIDSLIGDTLIAVLRQLRAGYDRRPRSFPQSVVLCGVRDVRDYRIRSRAENAVIAGGSAFNIRAESLRLGDFTAAEVRELLTQHTAETGQAFTAEAVEATWTGTRGQPWRRARDIWWSSTVPQARRGERRSTAARNRSPVGRSPCGACSPPWTLPRRQCRTTTSVRSAVRTSSDRPGLVR